MHPASILVYDRSILVYDYVSYNNRVLEEMTETNRKKSIVII